MSRLSKLYDAIETLRKEGVSTDDLEKKVSQAEEDIIKKEILPILTQNIEPALQQVKRELVLVVDYQPGQPISVHLSRKRNFTAEIADAKEIVQDPIVEHGERKIKQEKIERSSSTDMAVFFPDGTMIAEEHAKDTLEKVVRKIGVVKSSAKYSKNLSTTVPVSVHCQERCSSEVMVRWYILRLRQVMRCGN